MTLKFLYKINILPLIPNQITIEDDDSWNELLTLQENFHRFFR